MIHVRLDQLEGACVGLPRRIEVRGHAGPDLPRRGEGSRPEADGAPMTDAHHAIAESIARRVRMPLVGAARSRRGVALEVLVGQSLYRREAAYGWRHVHTSGSGRLRYEVTSYETTRTPRGRGWRREGHMVLGRAIAVIESHEEH